MVHGYIRVSKTEQNQNLQFDALKKAGCEKIYHEEISGASLQRPEYIRMISELRKERCHRSRRIDRLGRTTYELIKLMVEWKEMRVAFRSISEGIDNSAKIGRLWYILSFVFAENERYFLMVQTLARMEVARARGRPKGLTLKVKGACKPGSNLGNKQPIKSVSSCRLGVKL